MEIIEGILHTYAQFFNWEMWGEVLTDPVSWGFIGTLVLLEGLLSADNALVLAVMVKHLPPEKRKKALFYGLIGAYIFRFIAIGLGTYLIKLAWVKVLGATYLAWLTFSYFRQKSKPTHNDPAKGMKMGSILVRTFGVFWGTVVGVEIMDIAFSVDSVLAAFGVSEEIWILLIGGMLGILMMRGIASVFLNLIDKVPEMESAAYILIGIIATKMLASVFGYHLPHTAFFLLLVAVFAGTFLLNYRRRVKGAKQEVAATKEEE